MKLYKSLFSSIVLTFVLISPAASQIVYTWNGSVNSNFSAAGNWTPFRQIGLVTDILVFENSGNLNVINVYQVTIGQLIVRNNTNLTLSPASGNAKLITIKGGPGDDLLIEPGSDLKIFGNDPALNFYIGTGATASIGGNLTFAGSIAHFIDGADPLSIRFNNGSIFTQLSPGNIFRTTGTNNTAVFNSGSTFIINHAGALSPFGFSSPETKVMFKERSNFVVSNPGTLELSGRTFANLTVEQNSNINISESFTSDINLSNITVKNGGALTITNTNPNYIPTLHISGNITANGTLIFSDNQLSKFNIKFNGSTLQDISGNGNISIPSNLNMFELSNSISLHKDMTVSCPIIIHRNEILKNGFEFNFNPEFGNPFNGSKSESIISENAGKDTELYTNFTAIPSEYSLSQNYPNPFNPSTKINFSLPEDSKVTIKIFDITGKETSVILNSYMIPGNHSVSFNASGLSSGVYFYTINTGNYTKTLKMILIK